MDLQDVKSDQRRREAFIEEENICCICGTSLEFRHQINHSSATVTEEASCPVCGIRNKSRTSSIN